MTDKYQLQTVARALDCLAMIEKSSAPMSLTELSEAMGESTAIVYRMVCTLEAKGYLHRRPSDKRYAYTGRSMGSGAVTRAVDLLHAVAACSPAGSSVAELAMAAELDQHVVEELIEPLAQKALIESVGTTERWRLGLALLQIARPLLSNDDLIAFLQPLMERLHADTGETVSLFYRVNASQIVAVAMPSTHPVRYSLDVGRVFPLYVGAAGKAALAAMAEDDVNAVIKDAGWASFTAHKPEEQSLRDELEIVRRNGYAISAGERVEGASAVAVPVRDASGMHRAVLGLMMPSFRASREELEALGERMISDLRSFSRF
ncbi:IclR family transcriptional regulator domain-containing protein [Salinisphaera aquimarina]|uniref:IclR family transcriptional regulator C-terminal domain-containing protein n=1 Tax=Salinisphaera aquimarina TaxID=2094031 RepID=A0ABV7ET88_9GAMM